MESDQITELFKVRSHNPSFFTVQNAISHQREILDFCIPVNLHFPPGELTGMIRDELEVILRYYPDYAEVHQQCISEFTGTATESIVAGNGSTEIITLLCQHADGPILTSVPTFSRWTDLPDELRVPLHTIQRQRQNEFRLEVGQIVERVRETSARTLVISNPNNPTGAGLTLIEVTTLADALADLSLIVMDESFIDFSNLESAALLATQRQNLVVVKSLGKSLGWHGVRLGYAVANTQRAQAMRAQLPFWNINGLAAFVLKHVIKFKQEYQASFNLVAADRQYMAAQLDNVPGLTVFPSHANFLFVELPNGMSGRALRDRLLKKYGVMIRECSNKLGSSEQYLRLAVQRRVAVDVLIPALGSELH